MTEKNDAVPLWRQVQRRNFTRFEALADFLELSPPLRKRVIEHPRFPINIPYRLAAKMEKNTLDDPILRQFVPLIEELEPTPGFALDPVQDKTFQKTKKTLHKYKGRALILASGACAMNCRFCFRQNFPYETEDKSFDEELAYLKNNKELDEVVLSGGDPLSLPDSTLRQLFSSLDTIPHLKRIRFHTRFPIGIPERIDDSFLSLLANSSKQIVFIIHSNHPRELDADVLAALKKIQKLGIPVLNHSVLLKGVNDDEATLLSLSQTLVNSGIIPYYVNELDPIQGGGHFGVDSTRGPELIRHIQKNLSGFGVPRLVREEPGKSSKTYLTI